MSLKAFHVVFISLSILLAFLFGGWLIDHGLETGQPMLFVCAALSFLVGVSLIIYERRFLKKTKNIRYL